MSTSSSQPPSEGGGYILSGYLSKRGKLLGGYTLRFFVLTETQLLCYKEKKQGILGNIFKQSGPNTPATPIPSSSSAALQNSPSFSSASSKATIPSSSSSISTNVWGHGKNEDFLQNSELHSSINVCDFTHCHLMTAAKDPCSFEIAAENKVRYFRAQTPKDAKIWVRILSSLIQRLWTEKQLKAVKDHQKKNSENQKTNDSDDDNFDDSEADEYENQRNTLSPHDRVRSASNDVKSSSTSPNRRIQKKNSYKQKNHRDREEVFRGDRGGMGYEPIHSLHGASNLLSVSLSPAPSPYDVNPSETFSPEINDSQRVRDSRQQQSRGTLSDEPSAGRILCNGSAKMNQYAYEGMFPIRQSKQSVIEGAKYEKYPISQQQHARQQSQPVMSLFSQNIKQPHHTQLQNSFHSGSPGEIPHDTTRFDRLTRQHSHPHLYSHVHEDHVGPVSFISGENNDVSRPYTRETDHNHMTVQNNSHFPFNSSVELLENEPVAVHIPEQIRGDITSVVVLCPSDSRVSSQSDSFSSFSLPFSASSASSNPTRMQMQTSIFIRQLPWRKRARLGKLPLGSHVIVTLGDGSQFQIDANTLCYGTGATIKHVETRAHHSHGQISHPFPQTLVSTSPILFVSNLIKGWLKIDPTPEAEIKHRYQKWLPVNDPYGQFEALLRWEVTKSPLSFRFAMQFIISRIREKRVLVPVLLATCMTLRLVYAFVMTIHLLSLEAAAVKMANPLSVLSAILPTEVESRGTLREIHEGANATMAVGSLWTIFTRDIFSFNSVALLCTAIWAVAVLYDHLCSAVVDEYTYSIAFVALGYLDSVSSTITKRSIDTKHDQDHNDEDKKDRKDKKDKKNKKDKKDKKDKSVEKSSLGGRNRGIEDEKREESDHFPPLHSLSSSNAAFYRSHDQGSSTDDSIFATTSGGSSATSGISGTDSDGTTDAENSSGSIVPSRDKSAPVKSLFGSYSPRFSSDTTDTATDTSSDSPGPAFPYNNMSKYGRENGNISSPPGSVFVPEYGATSASSNESEFGFDGTSVSYSQSQSHSHAKSRVSRRYEVPHTPAVSLRQYLQVFRSFTTSSLAEPSSLPLSSPTSGLPYLGSSFINSHCVTSTNTLASFFPFITFETYHDVRDTDNGDSIVTLSTPLTCAPVHMAPWGVWCEPSHDVELRGASYLLDGKKTPATQSIFRLAHCHLCSSTESREVCRRADSYAQYVSQRRRWLKLPTTKELIALGTKQRKSLQRSLSKTQGTPSKTSSKLHTTPVDTPSTGPYSMDAPPIICMNIAYDQMYQFTCYWEIPSFDGRVSASYDCPSREGEQGNQGAANAGAPEPTGLHENPSIRANLEKFLNGTDEYRRLKLKIVPRVHDAPWLVNRAVGQRATLVARTIDTTFVTDPNGEFFEIDIDLNTSYIAKSVLGIVRAFSAGPVFDFYLTLDGRTEEDLPEYTLASVRLQYVDINAGEFASIEPSRAEFKKPIPAVLAAWAKKQAEFERQRAMSAEW